MLNNDLEEVPKVIENCTGKDNCEKSPEKTSEGKCCIV